MPARTLKFPDLPPADRAAFGTAARMLSCLVTESLARGIYLKLGEGLDATGICVVLLGDISAAAPPDIATAYTSSNILAVIPLRHIPVFKHDGSDPRGKEIGLLDPMDMLPLVFEFNDATPSSEHASLAAAISKATAGPGWDLSDAPPLVPLRSPLLLWEAFGRSMKIQETILKDITDEFESSILWQKYSFENPPLAPQFSSPSIDWEQSIVEGHPTHPMHKTRMFLPPIRDIVPGSYDLHHTKLRFVAVPRENLKITNDFEKYTAPLIKSASEAADEELIVPENFVVVPVHDLQVAHIQAKFPEALVYPPAFNLPILGQQSIRSVIVPNAYHELSLKLGVGIKLTSAVRTISPASAYLGPRFSSQVVPALTMDRNIVTVARELASVVHTHPDGEIAKHCSAIIREAYENTSEERGERLIVCTSLVESGHAGEGGHLPAVIRVFELDTEEKRLNWLDKFVKLFFEAFLPPVLENGVAFEAHPQNCVARFDIKTKELLGFIIRDFGGLRVHRESLRASTGVELDFLEGHSIIAQDTDDVYERMYHTVMHNHLQQLIRVLGLHYSGAGWAIVRRHLRATIPREHALYSAWLAPEKKTFPGKCFMRMRCEGMYRFHLHAPFPNLILYEGVQDA
ncbi:IucC family-domain-containing protein [Mycena albidolilacea]|uniref:IucC family-domain-containing protein n=1 Tax=Mycena albidolilacea TaxID=1033008 RepID=A0AAD7A906_9AGAR|nr:IucC family-domain-containing protein [Mycena albidolilacea]